MKLKRIYQTFIATSTVKNAQKAFMVVVLMLLEFITATRVLQAFNTPHTKKIGITTVQRRKKMKAISIFSLIVIGVYHILLLFCFFSMNMIKIVFLLLKKMPNPRTKVSSGRIRPKRTDTKIGTIEKKYGVELSARSDMYLGTYLKKKGLASLSKLLDGKRKK